MRKASRRTERCAKHRRTVASTDTSPISGRATQGGTVAGVFPQRSTWTSCAQRCAVTVFGGATMSGVWTHCDICASMECKICFWHGRTLDKDSPLTSPLSPRLSLWRRWYGATQPFDQPPVNPSDPNIAPELAKIEGTSGRFGYLLAPEKENLPRPVMPYCECAKPSPREANARNRKFPDLQRLQSAWCTGCRSV